MDARTQTIPIYRQSSAHPQALACAACEVRSAARFGVLDDAGLDRIHTQIASLTLAPDATIHDRGSAGLAVFTIREGLVRFEPTSEHDDRRIARIAGWGDLIGQKALDAAEAWVSDLFTGPARRRLLHLLRRLAEHAGPGDAIWLPRRDEIGAMLDMTVETASRLVSALRREGVLTLTPGRSVSPRPALLSS
jgi:CRP-like cAMP-binding protein